MAKEKRTLASRMPGEKSLSKYDNWSKGSDAPETAEAKRKLRRMFIASAVVLVIIIVITALALNSQDETINDIQEQGEELQKKARETPPPDKDGYEDPNVLAGPGTIPVDIPDDPAIEAGWKPPEGTATYVLPSSEEVEGTFSEENKALSIELSKKLAVKYNLDYRQFYVVGEKDGLHVLTHNAKDVNGVTPVFLAKEDGDSVSDNMYLWVQYGSFGTQGMLDNDITGLSPLAVLYGSDKHKLLPPTGNGSDPIEFQKTAAPDIVFVVSANPDGTAKSEDELRQILTDSYIKNADLAVDGVREFSITVVTVSNSDPVFDGVTEDHPDGIGGIRNSKLSYYNYATMLKSVTVDTVDFTVFPGGVVA